MFILFLLCGMRVKTPEPALWVTVNLTGQTHVPFL